MLTIRRSKLYYTASGIITLCRWPSRAQVERWPVHGTATYRWDDTRGCIIQFWPPDDEHIVLESYRGMLIKIQPDATVWRHLFTAKSLYMFRVSQHPSSEVLKTLTAACGTGHSTGTTTSLQRGLIRPRWREVAVPILWPVAEAAVTVFITPDDGCYDTRNT